MTSIPIKPNSKRHVIIDGDSLSFKDWRVRFDDITGLSFGSFSSQGNFMDSAGSEISIHTASSHHKIQTGTLGVLGFPQSEDNMQEIMEAVRQAVGPHLLKKLLLYIFDEGSPVDIGRFTLTNLGLAFRGLTGTKHVPWTRKPSCRIVSKFRWYSNTTTYGAYEVFYFDPRKGKNAVLGTVSSSDMNGFLLPIILQIIASQVTSTS